ncbi:Pollen-specific leucine-rich repeat extensin-like protein 1 [Platanthera zijinensis]|uniref:Cell wall hydroxyproline-rich glycoprotein n=1 Tax=Platanthera zijinensis TaxID=2320716 RepID=A0AAP0BCV3_9ASPA
MQWILSFLVASVLSLSPEISAFMGISAGVGVWINARPHSPPPTTDTVEYSALQSFKSAISDDPTGILSSWIGPDVCSYKGIFCSDSPEPVPSSPSTVVAIIDLNRANLAGTLTPFLSLLSHLSALHLNSNRFSGFVPSSLRDLQYLSELDLSNNLLSGPFPSATLEIPNLIYLDLRFNSFSGELPNELFQKDLDAIFLNNNQFQGEIPFTLWSSPASAISLANNQLTGSIPPSFGYPVSGLKEILLLNNKLTGCIPEGVGYATGMQVLDLSFNSLAGHLPDSISCLVGIEVLNIAHNRLSGELEEVVCDLRNLVNFTVTYNFFSGVSNDCARLLFRNIGFDLAGNCIPGKDLQRPEPECGGTPAGSLSCLRVPGMRPTACGDAGGGGMRGFPYFLP